MTTSGTCQACPLNSRALPIASQRAARAGLSCSADNFALELDDAQEQYVFVPRVARTKSNSYRGLDGRMPPSDILDGFSFMLWVRPRRQEQQQGQQPLSPAQVNGTSNGTELLSPSPSDPSVNFTQSNGSASGAQAAQMSTLASQMGSWALLLADDGLRLWLPWGADGDGASPASDWLLTPSVSGLPSLPLDSWSHVSVVAAALPAGCSLAQAASCESLRVSFAVNATYNATLLLQTVQTAAALHSNASEWVNGTQIGVVGGGGALTLLVDSLQLSQPENRSVLVGASWLRQEVPFWLPLEVTLRTVLPANACFNDSTFSNGTLGNSSWWSEANSTSSLDGNGTASSNSSGPVGVCWSKTRIRAPDFVPFSGAVDEVKMWQRALTAEQVRAAAFDRELVTPFLDPEAARAGGVQDAHPLYTNLSIYLAFSEAAGVTIGAFPPSLLVPSAGEAPFSWPRFVLAGPLCYPVSRCKIGTAAVRDWTLYPSHLTLSACCSPCPVGRYSLAGASACLLCPIGRYQEAGNATGCAACAAGKTTFEAGASTCAPIPAWMPHYPAHPLQMSAELLDSFRAPLATNDSRTLLTDEPLTPVSASSGRASFPAFLSVRGVCVAGSFAAQQRIEPPALGWDASTSRAQSFQVCLPCAPGTFSNASDAQACEPCAPGFFAGGFGATACQPSAAGHACTETGMSVCGACSAGSFTNGTGRSACDNCAAGHFQSHNASTSCVECEAGQQQPSVGASSCAACEPGSFSPASGASSCLLCAAASYAPGQGQTACSACPFGNVTAKWLRHNVTTPTSGPFNGTADAAEPGLLANSSACLNSSAAMGNETAAPLNCTDTNISLVVQELYEMQAVNSTLLGAETCVRCDVEPSSAVVRALCPRCGLHTHFNFSAQRCVPCSAGFWQLDLSAPAWVQCSPAACDVSNVTTAAPFSLGCAVAPLLPHGQRCDIRCPCGYDVAGAAYNCSFGVTGGGPQRCEERACSTLLSSGTCGPSMRSGANCSIACEPGSVLVGAPYQCRLGNLTGAQQCVPCTPNFFSPDPSLAYRACPRLSYALQAGAARCAQCPVGSFTLEEEQQQRMLMSRSCAPDNFALELNGARGQFALVPRPALGQSVAAAQLTAVSGFTAALWVRPHAVAASGALLSQLGSWSLLLSGGQPQLTLPGVGVFPWRLSPAGPMLAANTWHHVAAAVAAPAHALPCDLSGGSSCAALDVQLFLNGSAVQQLRLSTNASELAPEGWTLQIVSALSLQQLANSSLLVGADWAQATDAQSPIAMDQLAASSAPLTALVDEVKLWLRRLDAAEVAYAALDHTAILPFAAPASSWNATSVDAAWIDPLYRALAVYLHFDEGAGTVVAAWPAGAARLLPDFADNPTAWPQLLPHGPLCYPVSRCAAGSAPVLDVSRFPAFAQTACCRSCPVGTTSIDGGRRCVVCPLGRFAAAGATNCTACGTGLSTTAVGAAACTAQQRGKPMFAPWPEWHDANAAAEAVRNISQAAISDDTPLELNPTASGVAYPALPAEFCSPGSYVTSVAAVNFSDPVSALRFSFPGPFLMCPLCPVNQFAEERNASACKPCAPLTQTLVPGRDRVCTECVPGTWLNGSSCALCPAQTVGVGQNATACFACPVGTHSEIDSSSTCQLCPTGASTLPWKVQRVILDTYKCGTDNLAMSFLENTPHRVQCVVVPRPYSHNLGLVDATATIAAEPAPLSGTAPYLITSSWTFSVWLLLVEIAPEGATDYVSCQAPLPEPFSESELLQESCRMCPAGSEWDHEHQRCSLCVPGKVQTQDDALAHVRCEPCPLGSVPVIVATDRSTVLWPDSSTPPDEKRPGTNACAACAMGAIGALRGRCPTCPCGQEWRAPEDPEFAVSNPFGLSLLRFNCSSVADAMPPLGNCSTFALPSLRQLASILASGTLDVAQSAVELADYAMRQLETVSPRCMNCSSGRYQPEQDAPLGAQCIDSPAGHHVNENGSCQATPCQPGSAQNFTAQAVCIPCAPGSAVNTSGALVCPLCALHSYSNGTGWKVCATCPAETAIFQRGSSSPEQCLATRYACEHDAEEHGGCAANVGAACGAWTGGLCDCGQCPDDLSFDDW